MEEGWYHSFELPDGTRIDGHISLEALRERYSRFPIPEDLQGKRVLDIGAWDGWFSFEAERRGAAVTAIDCVELPSFQRLRRELRSGVDYRILDIYDLLGAGLGKFDFVFFLGILYHLKHPLLGLEIVCSLTSEVALVDSYVTDGDTWQDHRDALPSMEFYETDELAGRLDNWHGPSVACLLALCRAAGFPRVELLHAKGHSASVACFRRWEPEPARTHEPAPDLLAVVNHADFGINFTTRRDQYVACWFTIGRENVLREDLRLEVDAFGAPALYLRREDETRWVANFRLPPGLEAGWKPVRLRLADTSYSHALRIAVDLPLETGRLLVREVCDGFTWVRDEVRAADRGILSTWIQGLGDTCDRHNIQVSLGETRLRVEFVGEADAAGFRQVNAVIPGDLEPGEYPLRVAFGRATAEHASAVRVRK